MKKNKPIVMRAHEIPGDTFSSRTVVTSIPRQNRAETISEGEHQGEGSRLSRISLQNRKPDY